MTNYITPPNPNLYQNLDNSSSIQKRLKSTNLYLPKQLELHFHGPNPLQHMHHTAPPLKSKKRYVTFNCHPFSVINSINIVVASQLLNKLIDHQMTWQDIDKPNHKNAR